MAITGHIALLGEFLAERMKLNTTARALGWSIHEAEAASLAEIGNTRTPLVAVLIHPQTLGMPWMHALDLARSVAPGVRVVICHGPEELDAQPDMTASGAFYTLLLPSDARELPFMFAQLDASLAASSIRRKVQDRPQVAARVARAA